MNQTPVPGHFPHSTAALPAPCAVQHAWGAKGSPAPSPVKLPGGHSQNSP